MDDEPDLVIAAVPERERPFDLLLLAPGVPTAEPPAKLADLLDHDDEAVGEHTTPAGEAFGILPAGARLGTSSPRRQAGALALRPDLVCCAVRGSVGAASSGSRAARSTLCSLPKRGSCGWPVTASWSLGRRRCGASGWTSDPGPALPVRAPWRCRSCAGADSTATRP